MCMQIIFEHIVLCLYNYQELVHNVVSLIY